MGRYRKRGHMQGITRRNQWVGKTGRAKAARDDNAAKPDGETVKTLPFSQPYSETCSINPLKITPSCL